MERGIGIANAEAHTLAGSVANFHAARATELAKRLEAAGKTGAVADADETYRELAAELERLRPV